LRLHQPRGVGHQLGRHLHERAADIQRVDIAAAVKAISAMTAKGELGGVLGSLDSTNIQGETQKKLDVMSNTAFINTFSMGGLVAGLASEENDDPVEIDPQDGSGRFLAIFDPLDGSSNIDVNVSVGSIFSVLRAPQGRTLHFWAHPTALLHHTGQLPRRAAPQQHSPLTAAPTLTIPEITGKQVSQILLCPAWSTSAIRS